MRITNINTISALFDRLITENIKLFFFEKEKEKEKAIHQRQVILHIKDELKTILIEVYEDKYRYKGELRTYKFDDVIETVEELIESDLLTGEYDRANLEEATSDEPSLDNFKKNHKIIRKANERRAINKNTIDKQFEEFQNVKE